MALLVGEQGVDMKLAQLPLGDSAQARAPSARGSHPSPPAQPTVGLGQHLGLKRHHPQSTAPHPLGEDQPPKVGAVPQGRRVERLGDLVQHPRHVPRPEALLHLPHRRPDLLLGRGGAARPEDIGTGACGQGHHAESKGPTHGFGVGACTGTHPAALGSDAAMPKSSKTARQVPKKRKAPVRRRKTTVRGLTAAQLLEDVPADARALAEAITADGGRPLVAFRDPLGGHGVVLAALPIDKVQPTPYQRDLSEPHLRRLASAMTRVDRFLDPLITVRQDGQYWTPNGNHRLGAMRFLGAQSVVALVLPEPELAFQILALNTEKAHNPQGSGRWKSSACCEAWSPPAKGPSSKWPPSRGASARHTRRRLREAASLVGGCSPVHRQAH